METAYDGRQVVGMDLHRRPCLLPGDEAIAEVIALCGHLPLAISLVAGQLKHHPTWTTADLTAELKSDADRLSGMRAENTSVTASFDLSYRNLPAEQQRLFRLLGLHPGTDVDSYAAAALNGTGSAPLLRPDSVRPALQRRQLRPAPSPGPI